MAKAWSVLATGCRLILLDRRGSGASGGLPVSRIPIWEELAEDVVAVLDAAGSTSAAVISQLETGPIAILLAAMHPERVSSLILLTTTARYSEADDYPIGVPRQEAESVLDLLGKTWGTEELGRLVWLDETDPELHRIWARIQRCRGDPPRSPCPIRVLRLECRCARSTSTRSGAHPGRPHPGQRLYPYEPWSLSGRTHCRRDVRGDSRCQSDLPRRRVHGPDRGVRNRCSARRRCGSCPHHHPVHRHRGIDRAGDIAGRSALAHPFGFSRSCCERSATAVSG